MGIAAKRLRCTRRSPCRASYTRVSCSFPPLPRNHTFRGAIQPGYGCIKRSLRGARRECQISIRGLPPHPSGARNDRFVIVFDNYQEAPERIRNYTKSSLNGLSEIPEGINVIIIGRLPLPSYGPPAGIRDIIPS